jgi:tetratricopeptide (TPR) repeat protein
VQETPLHDEEARPDSHRTRVTPVSSVPTTGDREPDTERQDEPALISTERSPTGGPPSRRSSLPPTAMPNARSFLRSHEDLPRVIVSERPPPPSDEDDVEADTGRQTPPDTPSARARSASGAPPSATTPEAALPSSVASSAPASVRAPVSVRAPASGPMSRPPPRPETGGTLAEHLAASEVTEDPEAALRELKSALAQLGSSATVERAGVYVRIAALKRRQDKPREAISNLEKALTLAPGHRGALEELLELDVAARDWRAVANAEEQLLTTVTDDGERFQRLIQFAERWEAVAGDRERARKALERARELRGGDPGLLAALRRIYEAVGDVEAAIGVRRRLAEVAQVPREQARGYYELGQYLAFELHREDAALELFDRALETDPSMLEPLEVVATLLGERMDYGELERAYRRMLERIQRVPKGSVRSEVTWELCRRLGLLFRDHLENPELALDAFEDATGEKPDDIGSHLIAADLAKRVGRFDRAAVHLQAAVAIDPARIDLFHDLFDTFQKARSPDQAYAAACVTMFLRASEARERFVFEEHKPEGVPRMTRPLPREGWDLLRTEDRHRDVEAILAAIAPAAIAMRLAQLQKDKKLPALDPAARQDPETSTASIVRSFKWASHFLGVAAPAIYVHDDPAVNLAAVPAEEPSVFAGGGVLRGKTVPELAFLVGRHLAYYLPPHRLLLFYSSIEDLSALFVAAVTLVLPGVPVPKPLAEATNALRKDLGARLGAEAKAELARAVEAFEAGGTRADLARWVGAVERCATRVGLLLSGDLEVAAAVVRGDGRGVISAEAKVGDMNAFLVSDACHTLRRLLGVAVEP